MSDTIVHTPAPAGTQGAPVPTSATAADLTQTPAQAAAGSLVTDAGKTTPAAEPGSLVTDAGKQAVTDPAKNADGTVKTPEQIATEAKAEADKNAAKVVPEKYEIKFGDQPADEATLAAFTPLAKELGLTNEAAQKLATFHAEQINGILAQQKGTLDNTWTTTQETWRSAARADPEYGNGAGGKTFEENGALIAKGLASFGTPALNKALVEFGMGNHPEFARFFYRVGKAVSEDTIRVGGNTGSVGAPIPLANRLFPTMKQ